MNLYSNSTARCDRIKKFSFQHITLIIISCLLLSCEKDVEYIYPEHNYLTPSNANINVNCEIDGESLSKKYLLNYSNTGGAYQQYYELEWDTGFYAMSNYIVCSLSTPDYQNSVSMRIHAISKKAEDCKFTFILHLHKPNNEIIRLIPSNDPRYPLFGDKDIVIKEYSLNDYSHDTDAQIISFKLDLLWESTSGSKYSITGDFNIQYTKQFY